MERRRTRRHRHAAVHLVTLALSAALAARAAPAGAQVTPLPGRGGIAGSTVDWGALGAPFTPVPGSFSISAGGNLVTVSNATGTDMERRDQVPCQYWDGNFASCDRLLWTNSSPGTGPLAFAFSSPVTAFGTNIQADDPGPFTAFLTLYLGSSPLGTVVRSGVSDNAGDGSALFIGAGSTVPFDGAVLGLTSAVVDPGDFAIDGPTLGSTVPEPAPVALLGLGLAALGATRTRRRRAADRSPVRIP